MDGPFERTTAINLGIGSVSNPDNIIFTVDPSTFLLISLTPSVSTRFKAILDLLLSYSILAAVFHSPTHTRESILLEVSVLQVYSSQTGRG